MMLQLKFRRSNCLLFFFGRFQRSKPLLLMSNGAPSSHSLLNYKSHKFKTKNTYRAIPRSPTLMILLFVRNIFCVFRSLWRIFLSCMYWNIQTDNYILKMNLVTNLIVPSFFRKDKFCVTQTNIEETHHK